MFEGFFFVFLHLKKMLLKEMVLKIKPNQKWTCMKVLWFFLSIGNSRWPPPQDIVYKGPYGKTSELTNPPTVVVNKHAKIVFFN
jgi:hypothetical protein